MWNRSDRVGQVPYLNLTSQMVANNLIRRAGPWSSRWLRSYNLIRRDVPHVEKKRMRRSGSVSEPDITSSGKKPPS